MLYEYWAAELLEVGVSGKCKGATMQVDQLAPSTEQPEPRLYVRFPRRPEQFADSEQDPGQLPVSHI